MKITHVRIGKLESGPGFNNRRVELEAALDDGDNCAEVAEVLRQRCEEQLRGVRETDELHRSRRALVKEVARLEREVVRLTGDIKCNRDIIRQHNQLADLARAQGIEGAALLDDDLPF